MRDEEYPGRISNIHPEYPGDAVFGSWILANWLPLAAGLFKKVIYVIFI
jgi:hypothetical protein